MDSKARLIGLAAGFALGVAAVLLTTEHIKSGIFYETLRDTNRSPESVLLELTDGATS